MPPIASLGSSSVLGSLCSPDAPRGPLSISKRAPLENPGIGKDAGDDDLREYLVRVDWIHTLEPSQAFREKGMFANQNTVVRLRDLFTLERLTELFGLDQPGGGG